MAGGTSGGGRGGRAPIVGINVTPMVDVVLVLLVIMMVSANYIVSQSMHVELPKASNGDGGASSLASVTISAAGAFRWNDTPVTEAQLSEKLSAAHTANAEVSLVVSADKNATHGTVVHVMDLAKAQGITHFAIGVEASELNDVIPNPRGIKLVYLVSFVLHVGVAGWLAQMEVAKPPPPPTVVEMRSIPKPPPKVDEPPPPPPEPEAPKTPAPQPAPSHAAPPPPSAAPASAPAPDFGLSLAGGGGGPGGIAVPTGHGGPAPVRQAAARTLQATASAATSGCDEEIVKAKAISMPRPAYTDEATAAQIEGKVRVQLTLDETGKVTNATVVESLGHGLDEAAVAAVREASFSPATQCGKPVASTFTVAVRFTL